MRGKLEEEEKEQQASTGWGEMPTSESGCALGSGIESSGPTSALCYIKRN